MRINTNVSSLTAQEANVNTNKSLSNSLEKLSSGLKINKAADDASGLAIADKLRTQATSINQAVDNGNSAVALLQIADKSMAEQSNILDTVKAKLIQANTDTTSEDGRESIRKDIAKLLEQLDNIAEQTNYNGLTLLQASSDSQLASNALSFQVGEKAVDTITNTAIKSNTQGLGSAEAQVTTVTISSPSAGDEFTININGAQAATYTAVDGDTIDTVHAALVANFANFANAADYTISPQSASGNGDFVITSNQNNTAFTVDVVEGTPTDNSDSAPTTSEVGVWTTGALVAFTNAANTTSITIDGIQISVAVGDNVSGAGALTSTSTAAQVFAELKAQIEDDTTLNAAYTISGDENGMIITANAGQADPVVTEVTDAAAASKLGSLTNAGVAESHDIDFTAAEGNIYSVGDGTNSVSYTATASDTKDTINAALMALFNADTNLSATYTASTSSGADLTIATNAIGTDSTDIVASTTSASTVLTAAETTAAGTGKSLADLMNLTTLSQEDADSFQLVVDDAITDLNAYRGDIGSTQNQVESAVRNLMTQATNVQAAESIIRDVDYAAESANFNKQNIISQAGSYAISQANAVQQNVLRLLQ